ncbi:hypothetical protein NOF04DRAFT_1281155 [Fusarium oxysporum II5]|nr:hypothetical protein DER44DRAFT_889399 [Fusarium oxysporum]KAK2123578.1 hypothetical protein NOF04DRAFT_1281155 [Fusarium oxysporum II5]
MTAEQAAETWEMMNKQAEAGKPEAKEIMELVNQLRMKIKEYHEALDLQSKISQLNGPDHRALKVARNELHGGPLRRDGQKPNPILGEESITLMKRRISSPSKLQQLSIHCQNCSGLELSLCIYGLKWSFRIQDNMEIEKSLKRCRAAIDSAP